MGNITGEVLIEKIDLNTGNTIDTQNEKNHISLAFLSTYYLTNTTHGYAFMSPKRPASSTNRWRIYWSMSDIKQSNLINGIPVGSNDSGEVIGAGVEVNVGSPFFTSKVLPTDKNYLTFVADILPGTATRTIKSLGLGLSATSPDGWTQPYSPFGSGGPENMLTNLRLTTPCIQDTLTVIRITYRLYYDDPIETWDYTEYAQGNYANFVSLLKYISDGSTTTNNDVYYAIGNYGYSSLFYDPALTYNFKPSYICKGDAQAMKMNEQGIVNNPYSAVYKRHTNGTVTLNINHTLTNVKSMGTFFRSIGIYSDAYRGVALTGSPHAEISETPYMLKKVLPDNITPLKNMFKQTTTATGPFQDLSSIGSMSGELTINTSNWIHQNLPKLVRVNITSTGTESTATYNFEYGVFGGGFVQNTYCPREVYLPQDGFKTGLASYHHKTIPDNQILEYVTNGGVTVRSPDNNKYFVAVNCLRNYDSISYYDIETGNKFVLNATSTPALPVSNTSDMAVSNGYTFVTCSNTGLWQIDPTFTTVTHLTSIGGTIDSSKAYQIDVKENGDLWVLFEGGLAQGTTVNNGVSWSWTVYDTTTSPVFNATGITNSNWSNVTSMTIDPEHNNDRILFVLGAASTTNDNAAGFIWWERLTGTTTIMSTGVPYPSFNLIENLKKSDLIKCSGGYWFTNAQPNTGVSPFNPILYLTTYNSSTWSTKTLYTGVDGKAIPIVINNIKCVLFGNSSTNTTQLPYNTYTNSNNNRFTSFLVKNTNINALPATVTLNTSQIEFHLRSGALDTASPDIRNLATLGNASYPMTYMTNSNMIISFDPGLHKFSFSPIIPPLNAPNYNEFKGAFWKKYGWDGSDWVLNNNNSKTCHTAFEPLLDGLTNNFTNGESGTNFVNTESFIFVVGNGIMKDNATQFDYNIAFYPWESESITDLYTPDNGQISTVPSNIYGSVVDEPMTFRALNANDTGYPVLNPKGKFSKLHTDVCSYLGGEVIPPNTEFTIKFKLSSILLHTLDLYSLAFSLVSGTFTSNNTILSIAFNMSNNNLNILNGHITNPYANVIGTIPVNLLDIDKTLEIIRYKNNDIIIYYDGIIYGKINFAGVLYSAVYHPMSSPNSISFKGYYDMTISYIDYRRMAVFGHNVNKTGKFHDKFVNTTTNNEINNIKCTINNIPQTVLFTHYSESALLTNQVRIESGGGYLIFSEMPSITSSVSGSTTLPSLYPIITGGVVTDIIIVNSGSGFTSTPSLTITAPVSGVTATATANLEATNSVNSLVTINNAGSGYTPGVYPLSITGGVGTGATGNVYISSSGVVVSVVITNGGSNYSTAPSITFNAGTPTVSAVITAAIGKRIESVTITNGGSGYIPDANTSVTANTVATYYP